MKAIADTGFLVAFGNRRDYHHEWAVGIAEGVTEPLLTCEAVLAETAFHLGSSALVLAFLNDGLVRSTFVLGEHIARLAELAARYADRKPDLADLRRGCARLCRAAGGELEQIRFVLGHVSIQTTERYLGCTQRIGGE
jgi:predicted nucleic acid-binding protein